MAYNMIFATIAFAISAMSFFGVVTGNDMSGRVITGIIWSVIGLWWLTGRLSAPKGR
jgi:hypothetical protein